MDPSQCSSPWCSWSASTPLAVLSWPVRVAKERIDSVGGIREPVVLLNSAWTPLAVFAGPVVLLNSAWTPLAVLKLPVVL